MGKEHRLLVSRRMDAELRARLHATAEEFFADNDGSHRLDHKLPATMHTPEGKTLAELRLQYMQEFLHELAQELVMIIDGDKIEESCV